jgi:pilus assembly protein CpaE
MPPRPCVHITPDRGQLIAIRGAKGGVGTTAIATNLAVALHRHTQQPTALVDADFFAGDVLAALNLSSNRSVMDLLSNAARLDDDLLNTTLVSHSSGIDVLAPPSDFEQVERVKADAYQHMLEELRNHYAYIVVDCATGLDANTLAAMDLADVLLLVTTPELAALKNVARLIQLGARLGYEENKLRLVLNRSNLPGAISSNDFEQHLSYRTSFKLPNDSAVPQALASGEPLKASTKVAGELDKIARSIAADQGWIDQPHQRGLFGLRAA